MNDCDMRGNHGKTCTVASIDELRPYVCNFATNKKGIKVAHILDYRA